MPALLTKRLALVPCTFELAQAATNDRSKLERLLDAVVPQAYPMQEVAKFLPYLAAHLQGDSALAEWSLRFIYHQTTRTLIGDAGFKGRPDFTGTVEIGYGILPDYRRQGFALEAARKLVEWASAQPGVRRIVAECLPDNVASAGILEKAGLTLLGQSGDLLKWELKVI